MVSWFAVNSEVVFLMSLPSSDWYPELPGAKHYGRVLSPREYDGKKLGSYFPQLTPGREEFNAPGGFMIDMFDLPYLARSEEHTSELQSLMRISYAVFCLKKKKLQNTE